MVTLTGTCSAKEYALREMASLIDELPLLPQSLARILQLNCDDNDYFDQLERCAKAEPALAVRIVAKANSPNLAPASPVLTLNGAMVRLGGVNVRTLVASLAVQRVFVPTRPDQIRLWVHSILVAVATQRIAELVPKLGIDPSMAYLAGLLHDIGRFVMFEHDPARLEKVDETDWHSPDDLIRADIDVFSYTHCEIGYLACKRWKLPDQICQFVRHHHSTLRKIGAPKSLESLIYCNQLADRLAISILEKECVLQASMHEIERLIQSSCYRTPREYELLPASDLAKEVQTIKDIGMKIVNELGYCQ